MQTEITIEVLEPLHSVLDKLEKLGFILKEKVFLKDWYYSKLTLKQLQKLSYKNLIKNSFLVRNILDTSNKSFIIYKNKVLDKNNNVIAEEKLSTEIYNLENLLQIYNQTSLTNWCLLEQEMLIFSKDNICFALQIVKDLGIFIEYEENDSLKGFTEQEKINKLYNDLQKLGLTLGTDYSCKKVYLKFKKQV